MDPFTYKRICAILEGYIAVKVPADLRASVRLTYRTFEDTVILSEERPDWDRREWMSTELVQFQFHKGTWRVYAKPNGNEWIPVSSINPSNDFEEVLEQVEIDAQEVIWVT